MLLKPPRKHLFRMWPQHYSQGQHLMLLGRNCIAAASSSVFEMLSQCVFGFSVCLKNDIQWNAAPHVFGLSSKLHNPISRVFEAFASLHNTVSSVFGAFARLHTAVSRVFQLFASLRIVIARVRTVDFVLNGIGLYLYGNKVPSMWLCKSAQHLK